MSIARSLATTVSGVRDRVGSRSPASRTISFTTIGIPASRRTSSTTFNVLIRPTSTEVGGYKHKRRSHVKGQLYRLCVLFPRVYTIRTKMVPSSDQAGCEVGAPAPNGLPRRSACKRWSFRDGLRGTLCTSRKGGTADGRHDPS